VPRNSLRVSNKSYQATDYRTISGSLKYPSSDITELNNVGISVIHELYDNELIVCTVGLFVVKTLSWWKSGPKVDVDTTAP
jgi:hypothetical protein